MTNIELKHKWSGLSENKIISGFRSIRISAECICELYIGISSSGNKCLILALPKSKRLDFKGIQKENLSIEYISASNLIVLQLLDFEFSDLFDDLVLSLYQGIKYITQIDEYSNHFIETFYRWSNFFENRKSEMNSEDVIKGIIGELLVLKILMTSPERTEINYLLKAWTGPYDKVNDFELEFKNIEVKTKAPSGIDVHISSEFQLEVSQGKGLELYVVSLKSDFSVGIHIRELILEIKKMIHEASGDTTILWKALGQKNINAKNMSIYDIYRFEPINWISYDCADKNFPKLCRTNIPKEVNTLKYILRTSLLTPFIIRQSNF
jgi:hypothetical protein